MRNRIRNRVCVLLICLFGAIQANSLCAQVIKDRDGIYSAGSRVQAPKLLEPATVVNAGKGPVNANQGCTIAAAIGADGALSSIKVVRSLGARFDASAIQAVQTSKFVPGRYQGDAVPVWVEIWVPFHEDGSGGPLEMLPLRGIDHPPTAIFMPQPMKSANGQRPKGEGVSVISVLINDDGLPTLPRVVRPLGLGLDEKALALLEQSRFKPATRKGIPVPQRITFEQHMSLF